MPDGPAALTQTTLLIAVAALDVHTPKRNGKRILPAHQRVIDDIQRAIDTNPDHPARQEPPR